MTTGCWCKFPNACLNLIEEIEAIELIDNNDCWCNYNKRVLSKYNLDKPRCLTMSEEERQEYESKLLLLGYPIYHIQRELGEDEIKSIEEMHQRVVQRVNDIANKPHCCMIEFKNLLVNITTRNELFKKEDVLDFWRKCCGSLQTNVSITDYQIALEIKVSLIDGIEEVAIKHKCMDTYEIVKKYNALTNILELPNPMIPSCSKQKKKDKTVTQYKYVNGKLTFKTNKNTSEYCSSSQYRFFNDKITFDYEDNTLEDYRRNTQNEIKKRHYNSSSDDLLRDLFT